MSVCSILLVEDHAATRTALAYLLEQRRYEVVTARTAEEAIMLISGVPFDLIISDLGLPDADGWELMRHLRKKHLTLPAIAVSAYNSPRDLAKSREAGYSAHLVKPIDIDQLEEAINNLPSASPDPKHFHA